METPLLIFNASAGSGKTFNLAVQYITLLVARHSCEFANTLAVTFTNKATSEMKNRILEQLYGISHGVKDSEGYLRAVSKELSASYGMEKSDVQIRKQCAEALREILHNYSRFYVSTIDSFFQGILRNMAHELGLNARLQVEISDDKVSQIAVEHIINSLQYDDKELLPWLRAFVNKKIEETESSWDIRHSLKVMAKELFEESYLKRELNPINKTLNVHNIAIWKEQMLELRGKKIQELRQDADAFEDVLMQYGIDYANLSNGNNYVKRYIDKMKAGDVDVALNSHMQSVLEDPMAFLTKPQREKCTPNLRIALELLHEKINKLHSTQERIRKTITTINSILSTLYPLGITARIDEEIKNHNAENNRFSLSHTSILLRKMIQDSDAPFVFEKSGTRYRNVMIDEFQDTSSLQWDNFKILLMNNLSMGGMSMIVGDIKQSIYRWRNGDWNILYMLSDKGIRGFRKEVRELNTNYRSQGNIIMFNNSLFPKAAQWLDNLSQKKTLCIADIYRNVRQEVPEDKLGKGYVRVHIHNATKNIEKIDKEQWERETMQEMGQYILRLNQEYGVPLHKMTILIRKKHSIPKLITYFAEHFPHIRLISNEAYKLSNSVAVNMLICALNVLAEGKEKHPNPIPITYLKQHYLQDVMHIAQEPGKTSDNSFLMKEAEDILPAEFFSQRESLVRMPLYQLCECLYRILRLENLEKQDTYLLYFFDELGTYLTENPADIQSFLQHWENKLKEQTVPATAIDGVNILTIHKSKGLEYHTVFVPFCDHEIEKDKNTDKLWCTASSAPMNALGSIPINTNKMPGTEFDHDYYKEHNAKKVDELNVLYVAFTRAESNLFVWGTHSEKPIQDRKETSGDIIAEALCMNEDVFEIGELSSYEPLPMDNYHEKNNNINRLKNNEHSIKSFMCSFNTRTSFRQSSPAARFVRQYDKTHMEEELTDKKQIQYVEKGKLLHYLFSRIHTQEDIDNVLRDMLQQGLLRNEAQLQEAKHLAERGLHHQTVRSWFEPGLQLFNECDILTIQNGQCKKARPDRVMMKGNRVVVVDFKFGRPEHTYKEQVREYMEFMQQMYPRKRVEGYLWYVYQNKVERV